MYIKTQDENLTTAPMVHFDTKRPITALEILLKSTLLRKLIKLFASQFIFGFWVTTKHFECTTALIRASDWLLLLSNSSHGSWVL